MLGEFMYHNPTTLYFGSQSLENLDRELPLYGPNVLLVYGGGSIKKNGIYDAVLSYLKKNHKVVTEVPGVMPNPTAEKLREGAKAAKDSKADLILAVGGGSCCDFAKGVAVSAYADDDPWEKFYVRFEEPKKEDRIVPVACILTMVGTGSEMNAGSVITNHEEKRKVGHVFADARVFPRFSILNPEFTFTLPKRQMVAWFYYKFNQL